MLGIMTGISMLFITSFSLVFAISASVYLLFISKNISRKGAAIVSGQILFITFFINALVYGLQYDQYKADNIAGNIYENVYCPLQNNGNYSGQCSIAISKQDQYSFLKYTLKYGTIGRKKVDIANFNQVLSDKNTGELYLKVYARSFRGADREIKLPSSNKIHGEYVKFSNLPKLFDSSDINALADSSIMDDDSRFNHVIEFDKKTKKPILQ